MTDQSNTPVLIISKNLPPATGGIERLWNEGVRGLSRQRPVMVVGPAAAAPHLEQYCIFYPAPAFLPALFLVGLVQSLRAAWKHKPVAVIAGSGVMAPLAWLAARLSGSRCSSYLHGLDIIYPSPVYQTLFLPFIRRMDFIFTNSQYTASLADKKGIDTRKISVVSPGVNMPPESEGVTPTGVSTDNFNLVFWGRIVERKGLSVFLRKCMPELLKHDNRYHLHVAGQPPANDTAEYDEAMKAVSELELSGHVTFHGRLPDDQLFSLLRHMNIHVFPLIPIEGDAEGFGMVALEAASFGVPTVAFNCGGVADAISEAESGHLVEPGDYTAFTERVINCSIPSQSCLRFAENASWERFCSALNQKL